MISFRPFMFTGVYMDTFEFSQNLSFLNFRHSDLTGTFKICLCNFIKSCTERRKYIRYLYICEISQEAINFRRLEKHVVFPSLSLSVLRLKKIRSQDTIQPLYCIESHYETLKLVNDVNRGNWIVGTSLFHLTVAG